MPESEILMSSPNTLSRESLLVARPDGQHKGSNDRSSAGSPTEYIQVPRNREFLPRTRNRVGDNSQFIQGHRGPGEARRTGTVRAETVKKFDVTRKLACERRVW